TAALLTSPRTGAMTKRERNSASPASTMFGGMVGVARALRARARTTKILVNDVIMRMSAGATESSPIATRVVTAAEGAPSGPLISTDSPPPGSTGAAGASGATGGSTV